jgi:hypothetical protein
MRPGPSRQQLSAKGCIDLNQLAELIDAGGNHNERLRAWTSLQDAYALSSRTVVYQRREPNDSLSGVGDHPSTAQDKRRARHLPIPGQWSRSAKLAVFFQYFLGVGLTFITEGLRKIGVVKAQYLSGEIARILGSGLPNRHAGDRNSTGHLNC